MPHAPPPAPDSISAERRVPSWRQSKDSDKERLCAQDERDNALYASVLRNAVDGAMPLQDLYLEASRLGAQRPEEDLKREAQAYAQRLEYQYALHEGRAEEDNNGNPLWISLSLRERNDDGPIKVPGVLPSGADLAVPKDQISEKKDAKNNADESGLFGVIIRLLRRLTSKAQAPRQHPLKSQGVIPPPSPAPLRGFFRMLLLGAAMALGYYMLQRMGFLPGGKP